jgi:hypothetical protein
MITLDYRTSETKVSIRLGVISENITEELLKTISEIVQELQAYVITGKLSGQVLHRRSGKLIRGIKRRVYTGKRGVFGVLTTTAPYGLAHEFGVKKTERVREHLRAVKNGASVRIRAHARKIDYPKHPYMRPAFKELQSSIRERIEDAIAVGVSKES